MSGDAKIAPPKRVDGKLGMEEMIHHYKLYTEGFCVPEGVFIPLLKAPKVSLVFILSQMVPTSLIELVRAPGFAFVCF